MRDQVSTNCRALVCDLAHGMHGDVFVRVLLPGNHSCEPNAEIHFRDNSFILSLVALTDIGAGDVSSTYM